MKIIEEKEFSLSFPVVRSTGDYIPFIDMDRSARVEDFQRHTKIFKNGSDIHIVWDDRGDGKETVKKTFKTTICKLDLESGNVTNTAFYCDHWNFNSAIVANYLVRSVAQRELQVYNMNGNKLEYNLKYSREKHDPEIPYYLRIGRNRAVRTDLQKYAPGGFLLGAIPQRNGDFVMIVGASNMESVTVPLVVVPVHLKITPSMNIPLKSIVEEEYVSRYSYYRGNFTSGFVLDPAPALVRRVIDDYEIAQIKNGTHYDKKAYLPIKDGVLAIYKERAEQQLKLVMFPHPQGGSVN